MKKRSAHFLPSIAAGFVAVTALLAWAAAPAHAQLRITASTPAQNAILAPANASVQVTFDREVDPASLSENAIRLFGEIHGKYNWTAAFDTSNRILRLSPVPAFMDGEQITAVFTAAVRAQDGAALAQPFRLGFRTRAPGGNILGPIRDVTDIFLFPEDQQPACIAAGDFNRDNFPDAAVVNSISNSLTILLNTAFTLQLPSLKAEQIYPTGDTPVDVAAGDFDNDDLLDLAVVNFSGNSVSIYWGRGDGTFRSTPITIPVGAKPSGLAVDDFDRDGWLDLAVSLFGSDKIAVLLNEFGQTLRASVELPCDAGTFGVVAGDFDGDGDADLSAINNGANTISFFLNTGNGAWQQLSSRDLPLRPVAIHAGNVFGATAAGPGDALQEVVVLTNDMPILIGKAAAPGELEGSQITVFQFDPDLTAMEQVQTFSTGSRAQAFGLASLQSGTSSPLFPQDHDLDLVLGDYAGDRMQFFANEDNAGWAHSFAEIDSSQNPRAVALADFDRDGDTDILYANHLQDKLRLILTPNTDSAGTAILIDFGDVFVGTTKDTTFMVDRHGSLDLDFSVQLLDEINFGAAPKFFSRRNGQPFPLDFSFSPTDTLSFETRAVITSTYPFEQDGLLVILRGHGVTVDFNLEPTVLDFQTVPPGLRKTLNLTASNGGNGLLALPLLENNEPVFTHPAGPLFVQPYGSLDIPVTFSPQQVGRYRDTLWVHSNSLAKPVLPVILLGNSSFGAPQITSPDTATAIEHQFFSYIATAVDPDGDDIIFRYQNLPTWLTAAADSLYGVPPEGAASTTFRIIASDGFLEDSLDVYLRVIPVNDPPRIANLPPQQVLEMDRLLLTISATDPEGEKLALSAAGVPAGAVLQDNGNSAATFDWTPAFGTAGTYDIRIVARETVSVPALADTAVLRVVVVRRKPDLEVTELVLSHTDIKLNQAANIFARITNNTAPVVETFVVRLSMDGQAIHDTTVNGMAVSETFDVQTSAVFDRLGNILIEAVADAGDEVPEDNKENNRKSLRVRIEPGQLLVQPNPFTPNGDGFNDIVTFDMQELAVAAPALDIYTMNGRIVRTVTEVRGTTMQWDGNDPAGAIQMPGVYLYILKDGAKNVAQGYVVLAR